jgi:hypothetical protein
MRSGILALRTVNQYRSRDILVYLGLRYYFSNQCARRDLWARDVASHLLLTRTKPVYFQSHHYKEKLPDGVIMHRDIYLPGANESYAEAALLAECEKHNAFKTHEFVFSYRLAGPGDTQGVYRSYFPGLQERHQKIAEACRGNPKFIVRYTDIKRFYPSISAETARNAWISACQESQLPTKYYDLGLKILADYSTTSVERSHGNGLLTGPMFSHLIANLVFRKIDEEMSSLFLGRYFRYVDDVVLVGTDIQITEGRELLSARLNELGLELHSPGNGKDFEISANAWMAGETDFEDGSSSGWMSFVRDLKHCLVFQPSSTSTLSVMLSDAGFRIPVPDYSVAVSDAGYQQRLTDSIHRHPWLLKTIFKRATPEHLLLTAKSLRYRYTKQLELLFEGGSEVTGYERKRVIPKIRYLAGRLMYLGRAEDLSKFSIALEAYPELHVLSETMSSVVSRDVTRLLDLGNNAVQSAAQVLKLEYSELQCGVSSWSAVKLQGLATLRANGFVVPGPSDDELNRLSLWHEGDTLMKSKNIYIQELACLHGASTNPRHVSMLDTAFDRGEHLTFDAAIPLESY